MPPDRIRLQPDSESAQPHALRPGTGIDREIPPTPSPTANIDSTPRPLPTIDKINIESPLSSPHTVVSLPETDEANPTPPNILPAKKETGIALTVSPIEDASHQSTDVTK